MSMYYYYLKRSIKENKKIMISTSIDSISKSRQLAMDTGSSVSFIHKINTIIGAINPER